MESCSECLVYYADFDGLRRDFDDSDNQKNHFCPCWEGVIPDGIFEGQKDCRYFVEYES